MKRKNVAELFGSIDIETKTWARQDEFITDRYCVPEEIRNHPDYQWKDSKGNPVSCFYTNEEMKPVIDRALRNLVNPDVNKLSELQGFGGSFNIRNVRMGKSVSAHAWGLAIDVNPAENPQGSPSKLSEEFVNAFKDAGFLWGGDFSSAPIDAMHFTLTGF